MYSNWEEETVDHMDDIVDMVDDSQSVPVLLPEILSHIFSYLSLNDRKTVRLICRSWYDCSVCPNVVKREKHVFRVDSSIEDIVEFMLRSNYSSLNLEFQGVRLEELPADVWQVCGKRIQTLELYECHWGLETIRNVILYCENLMSIVIKSARSYQEATCDLTKILHSSNLLNDLMKKGFQGSKLRTFAMLNDDVQLPESVLSKVFLFFPSIKHFSTGEVAFKIPCIYCPFLYQRRQPRFLSLDQCFSPETRLESLTLNSLMDGNWMETLVKKAEQGFGLKKLETILLYRRSMEDTVFEFFKSQRNLQILKLGTTEATHDENKKLFFHILDSCPNLQELFFETDMGYIHIDTSELPRFISSISKLKFLSTIFFGCYGTPVPLYQDSLAKSVQLNLTTLRWESSNVDFCAAFFQHCPFLQHLHFGGCSNETLQIIFQFLVELRTLVLCNIDVSCTDYGFTGRVDGITEGYSIKRLQQLKYLKLRSTSKIKVTKESTLELQLPRLEFLSLNARWLTELPSDEALDHFAFGLPELRVLAIEQLFTDYLQGMTRRFCQQLKNLNRLICFESRFNHHDAMGFAEDIFGSCPRLRYICDCVVGVFSRNSVTGRVLHNNLCSFKFPGSVFESGTSTVTREEFHGNSRLCP